MVVHSRGEQLSGFVTFGIHSSSLGLVDRKCCCFGELLSRTRRASVSEAVAVVFVHVVDTIRQLHFQIAGYARERSDPVTLAEFER